MRTLPSRPATQAQPAEGRPGPSDYNVDDDDDDDDDNLQDNDDDDVLTNQLEGFIIYF